MSVLVGVSVTPFESRAQMSAAAVFDVTSEPLIPGITRLLSPVRPA